MNSKQRCQFPSRSGETVLSLLCVVANACEGLIQNESSSDVLLGFPQFPHPLEQDGQTDQMIESLRMKKQEQ